MRYARLGNVPAKRHVQVRSNGSSSPLLVEEVMGYEGFSGNESILLHLQSPCRLDTVGAFRSIERLATDAPYAGELIQAAERGIWNRFRQFFVIHVTFLP